MKNVFFVLIQPLITYQPKCWQQLGVSLYHNRKEDRPGFASLLKPVTKKVFNEEN